MPTFSYIANDRLGSPQTGFLEEDSFEDAVATLRARQWMVVDLEESDLEEEAEDWKTALNFKRYLPYGVSAIEFNLRQLAVMLRSGLTLLDALKMLVEHAGNIRLAALWQEVAEDVLSGDSLAAAMQERKRFPDVVVQLVRVGEQTGELEDTLHRAATILEQRRRLKSQILSALAYPLVVFVAAVFIAAFMVFSVIPKLQRFLQAFGRKLPPLTQMLVDVTDFVNKYVWHGIGLLVFLVVLIVVLRSWPPSRWWFDRLLLYVPVVGKVLRISGTASLARNLQTLLQSGVSLLDGLDSIEHLLNSNKYLAGQISAARNDVVSGRSLADSLQTQSGFTPMMARMVAIGESAGRLDEVLAEAADFYEDHLARLIRKLAAMVEPVMLLVVGGIVGFVYIAFFMALFAAAR